MTKEAFLKYINDRCTDVYQELDYDRATIEEGIKHFAPRDFDAKLIVNFCFEIGYLKFSRKESVSGDKLTVHLFERTNITYVWNDIGEVVNRIGDIEDSAGIIEEFFMSETGGFYNQLHKKIAESVSDFYDYLLDKEYDYHPKPSDTTYKMLRHFGWTEGRSVDTTAFEQNMKSRNVTLSEAQLAFFTEFCGLQFLFKTESWWFYRLNEVLEKFEYKETVLCDGEYKKLGLVRCGETEDSILYIDCDGVIYVDGITPLGRTTMECINHLCSNDKPESEWK